MHRSLVTIVTVLLASCGGGASQMLTSPSTLAVPAAPTASRASTFEITFTADSACSALPVVARSRSYSVTVAPGAAALTLSGSTFGGSNQIGYPSSWNVIYQQTQGDAASWSFQDPEIWESLDTGRYVVIYGGPARIDLEADTQNVKAGVWSFWGRFTYCSEAEPDDYPECEAPEVSCESAAHTLTVVRR